MKTIPWLGIPANRLVAALVLAVLAAAAAIALATRAPWAGLTLRAQPDGAVTVEAATGPSAALPAGARLVALGAPGAMPLALRSDDLMEEPDLLPGYQELDAFLARQSSIAALLAAPQVALHWQDGAGMPVQQSVVAPGRRPVAALPGPFWFQLAVSLAGCLLATWVWTLRPHDPGARMFLATGWAFPAFALPAAVYGTRELALDGDLFRALGTLNHFGAAMWGAALVALFLAHPRPLVRPSRLGWPFAVFGMWWLADATRLAPDLDWGSRFLVMTEMLLAIVLAMVQWRRSRREPIDRASLRWLSLSLLVGSGLFIVTMVASTSLGWMPALPQGYAFGFFLFVYLGIALGLGRYRLFALDAWAYRMLLWIGGAVAVVALDALLVLALDWPAAPALGASVWACGLAYFPARQWLWRRVARRSDPAAQAPLTDVVRIAFQSSIEAQAKLWDALLQRLWDPLELRPVIAAATDDDAGRDGTVVDGAGDGAGGTADGSAGGARIGENGLAILVPACGGLGARRLRYAQGGRRLFVPSDLALVDAMCTLMDQAARAREAQQRGALEERRRIARDMHDDVGARLLQLVHRADASELAEIARAAMTDLRTALSALDVERMPLGDALAGWRAEAAERCDAAGVALDWQAPAADPARTLAPRHRALAERALREGLSNALRHARPTRVSVRVDTDADTLAIVLVNDGAPAPPQRWTEGRGLRGMRVRLDELGGTLAADAPSPGAARLALRLPYDPPAAR